MIELLQSISCLLLYKVPNSTKNKKKENDIYISFVVMSRVCVWFLAFCLTQIRRHKSNHMTYLDVCNVSLALLDWQLKAKCLSGDVMKRTLKPVLHYFMSSSRQALLLLYSHELNCYFNSWLLEPRSCVAGNPCKANPKHNKAITTQQERKSDTIEREQRGNKEGEEK